MKKKRMVLALGGNALGKDALEQRKLVDDTAKIMVELLADGHELVISHGNGPQVGMIHQAFEAQAGMPFPECGAMSQGYIGYHLQQALKNALVDRGMDREVITLLSQVVVDPEDPAFQDPTKPIGAFYGREAAEAMMAKDPSLEMREDAGRGWRRVVPSPKPVDMVEHRLIKGLVAEGALVIACGGGGVPVLREAGRLRGVSAVIDKDFASAKMASLVDADWLVILTAVDEVMLGYGSPEAKPIREVDLAGLEALVAQGHFAKGSMLPKVEAAMSFLRTGGKKMALITSLERAKEGIQGLCGTRIRP